MEPGKKFRTRTGYCHIFADKIVLTGEEMIENIESVKDKNRILPILIVYALIATGLIYVGFDSFNKKDIFMTVVYAMITLYLINAIISSWNNSTTPVIERNSIKKVIFKKGVSGLTRNRFEVFFTDHKGKSKKRMIILPGPSADGRKETVAAYEMMIEEKLLET